MKTDAHESRRGFLAAAAGLPSGRRELETRMLGKTGLKLTTLGFGCAWTSDASVFTRALDLGVNYFDTAPVYQNGNNEPMLRAGIGKRRKEVVISTKTEAGTKRDALAQLEKSLKELDTDHVDIWFLHSMDRPGGPGEELVEAQEIAKRQGKTRFIGVSTHRLAQTAPVILKTGKFDVVLAAYNFMMEPAVGHAAETLYKAGIGLIDMKAMAGGAANPRWPGQEGLPGRMRRPGVPAASLRWVLRNKMFSSSLVGMLSVDELEENLAAASGPFTDADGKLLASRFCDIGAEYCRMCGRCDGVCPNGLAVSDVLRSLMYADMYGQFAAARQEFLRLPAEARAARCVDCGECPVTCPNGVRIRSRLIKAQSWFA